MSANPTNKTAPRDGDVADFLASVPDEQRRRDAETLVELCRDVTRQSPVLWGTSIIGFGSRHYRYESGREGDTPAVGLSPRKAQTVVYLTGGLEQYEDLLAGLGPHQTGKGCLYLKQVDRVDPTALRQILSRSYRAAETDHHP